MAEREKADCVVIGAGVVGLAVAARLARAGREVLVLESGPRFGEGTSSRNSEVIHAGIHYPAGSLKARLCVAGRELLYQYCKRYQIPHERCGKLIVATDPQQESELAKIQQRALANGVQDLEWLGADQVAELEPAVRASSALLSPSTGIVDSHALMLSLLGQAESAGAQLVLDTHVDGLSPRGRKVDVQLEADALVLEAGCVVNAAGHGAVDLANSASAAFQLAPALARGHYFVLAGRSPFSRLIYPVPEPGGLGVHLTLDLQHHARFGPDVEWVEEHDYRVDPSRVANFYRAIRSYWPALQDGALQPGYAGIRPKIRVNGELHTDFLIQHGDDHGVAGLVNLLGIESPGLTASLAIAEYVHELL